MSSFDFPEDFSTASSGGDVYMKLKDGANKFRVLSDPIFGQQHWKTAVDENGNKIIKDGNEKRVPVRVKLGVSIPDSELEVDKWGRKEITHFMAFAVWSYSEKKVMVLVVDKKTINAAIKVLVQNEDWGDPRKYDLTVTKSGSGRDTEYSVTPSPHKELDADIKKQYSSMKINLEALFTGENPFDSMTQEEKSKITKKDDLPF